MSGGPNTEQVRQLLQALAQQAQEKKKIAEAQATITHQELCLSSAQQRLGTVTREIEKLLQAMDCDSPGNHGYEGRRNLLLQMLCEESAK